MCSSSNWIHVLLLPNVEVRLEVKLALRVNAITPHRLSLDPAERNQRRKKGHTLTRSNNVYVETERSKKGHFVKLCMKEQRRERNILEEKMQICTLNILCGVHQLGLVSDSCSAAASADLT